MIFENQPNEWYYALESSFGDKNAFDWREDASAYGPFTTYDEACKHLAAHHSNPGGHSMIEFADMQNERDEVTEELVKGAPDNMKLYQRTSFGYGRRW